jgi:hypothetical protein
MQTCRHCGKENEDGIALCSECGLELGPSPLARAAGQVGANTGHFFRRRPAATLLSILTALYAISVPMNLFLSEKLGERGEHELAQYMRYGAFWNAVIVLFGVFALLAMNRQTRKGLFTGASCIAVSLLVILRTWVGGLISGRAPFPVLEACLTWLPLLYAMIYALREGSRHPATPQPPS